MKRLVYCWNIYFVYYFVFSVLYYFRPHRQGGAEASVQRFQQVQRAWETLRSDLLRREYDLELEGLCARLFVFCLLVFVVFVSIRL